MNASPSGKTPLSPRRALVFLWAFFTLPILLGALVLLCVAITLEGRLFALATMTLVITPSIAVFAARTRWLSRALFAVGSLALLACIIRAPSKEDGEGGRAQVLFLGDTRHSRFSPANLVPEADQQIMGAWLMGFVDPLLSIPQARQLRNDITDLSREFVADKDLRALPSVMGIAYSDLFLGSRPVGNLFCYVPDTLPSRAAQVPVVLFLHGSLGNFQAYWVILKQLADAAGVAVVAPTFGAGNWHLAGGSEAVAHAVRFCRDHPRIDGGQIHLAALSNGGTGLTRAAAASPADFESLILLSAVTELPIIGLEAFREGWKGRRVLLVTGETDNRVPASAQRAAEARMRTADIRVTAHYLKDTDHFLFFTRRREMLELLGEWLETL